MILLPIKISREKNYKSFMISKFFQLLFISTIIVVTPNITLAQKTLELGVFAGGSYYLGDINPALHFNQTQLAYGGVARYNLSHRWTVKGSFYHGKVKGDDKLTNAVANRELNFLTRINDISIVAEFSWFDYFTGSKRSYFTPYIFAGVSYFMFKPKAIDGTELQPLGTEGQNTGFEGRKPYSLSSLALPFGIGVKYSINSRLGLAFEWGLRKTLTDYIDDVSTTYYEGSISDPYSDPTASHEAGMQRGDSSKNDWYGFTGITLTYKFDLSDKTKCNTSSY